MEGERERRRGGGKRKGRGERGVKEEGRKEVERERRLNYRASNFDQFTP